VPPARPRGDWPPENRLRGPQIGCIPPAAVSSVSCQGAPTRCLCDGKPSSIQCGCDWRDVILGGVAADPVSHRAGNRAGAWNLLSRWRTPGPCMFRAFEMARRGCRARVAKSRIGVRLFSRAGRSWSGRLLSTQTQPQAGARVSSPRHGERRAQRSAEKIPASMGPKQGGERARICGPFVRRRGRREEERVLVDGMTEARWPHTWEPNRASCRMSQGLDRDGGAGALGGAPARLVRRRGVS